MEIKDLPQLEEATESDHVVSSISQKTRLISFKNIFEKISFSSLLTTAKNIIGSINELKGRCDTLDTSVSKLNTDLFQGKYIVLASYTSHSWGTVKISNIRNYKMIQILLRDSNGSECASNIIPLDMFDDCISSSHVFGAWRGTGDSNCALSYYINDTTVAMYIGSNFTQAVLVGWY